MEDTSQVKRFRLQRSDETFEEALLLAKEKHYNTVVNRLYYAAFYAISALLLKEGIFTKTHSGLKIKFHERVIKENRISKEESGIYNELFDYRHDADYKDLIVFTKEEIEPFFEKTQMLIDEIKKLIKE